jgi:biotin-(acetyl-CoA carboxylase) ligase
VESQPTAAQVAEWMLQELNRERQLFQEDAAKEIVEKFGNQFVYINDNVNLAIERAVLFAFRKLSEETVVWDREDHYWRMR